MKLNPSKCAFGVASGKFLGFMISHRGIEVNPKKIKAILDMKASQNIKEVQSLTRRVAALNRFVSKATDKCLPFFKVLKKEFEWTNECQKAFQDLKMYLVAAPIRDGRRIVFIPGSNSTCCKLSIDKRGRKSTEVGVLY